ncbi:MAG: PVC-type heme-binding CxxCH protein, partial [Verrucomicrobiota bacterium]
MMNPLPLALFCLLSLTCGEASPIRVLFLGHDGTGPGQGAHQPHLRFPILQQVLGPEAIYFDYHSSPKTAFRDPRYLQKFDAVLIYANHREIERKHWNHLLAFIEKGGGFVPVHCASWCFQNIPEYEQVLGARFRSHRAGIFQARNLQPENLSPEMKLLPTFEAWDETYYHRHHQEDDRIVIQVRDPLAEDPHSDPEPWTWIRQQGNGRVFYTASGHDERTWSLPEFHQLLKMGILWSVGEERKASYQTFLDQRVPLRYESRPTIPNYEKRPQPPLFQLPLSPEDSLSYTKAPVGFRLQLFAAEPDIINPTELAWDHRGRLWTIETVDYPNEVREGQRGDDSIKILEDTDGDGLCDKVTVFATGLNIPTSLTPYRDGVIIHHPPHTVFLRDTNGDDRCDTEEVLFTGWGLNDTHAGPANLRWGPDNHVWGTVGYAAYRHKGKDFRMGIYRFRPD